MSDTIRWGILSTANIGRRAVAPAIIASSNGSVAFVASRDRPRAEAYVAELGLKAQSGSYEDLITSTEVDAIYNPLPNSMHVEWSARALEFGKPVLCEKPLGVSAEECLQLHEVSERTGVPCMEAFMYRFHPRIERTRDLIADGVIGDVRSLYGVFTFRLTVKDNIRWMAEFGGGALMDVGCYCVNVSRTLLGTEPERAMAHATWADTGVDAQLDGVLSFADGVEAHVACGLTMERNEFVQVIGTEGRLELEHAFLPGTDAVTIREHHGREDPVVHRVDGVDEYQVMVEHFADVVTRGIPVRYPLTEAAANMRAIGALYTSARAGGAVTPV